jgi:hypothetical protein
LPNSERSSSATFASAPTSNSYRDATPRRHQSWTSRPSDTSNQGAALLLLQFRKIAADEFQSDPHVQPFLSQLIPPMSSWDDIGASDQDSMGGNSQTRCRTVSLCDKDPTDRHRFTDNSATTSTSSTFLYRSAAPHTVPPSPPGPKVLVGESLLLDLPNSETLVPKISSAALVGMHTRNEALKGVLRRKFSWKNYPELETYLMDNRGSYLQYSSQLNYTSEQKRYNNKLTQGLLDLASEEGYVFEDFTFSAIRDRIRCYYKSCVQAAKKKKRKRRK